MAAYGFLGVDGRQSRLEYPQRILAQPGQVMFFWFHGFFLLYYTPRACANSQKFDAGR
jgi:hypothetical protein